MSASNTIISNVRFTYNPHGCNKNWDFEKLATGFQDKIGTLQDVVDHVRQGHALCAGLLGGQRRSKANVIGSQLGFVDIDNSALDAAGNKSYCRQLTIEEALVHPFIQKYAVLIYTSASHTKEWHRFRIVFLFPQFESDVNILEAMILQLMEQLPHDPACKDASRVFYGNTNAEIPLFNPSATLPAEWREKAIATAAEEASRREQQRRDREARQKEYQRQIKKGELSQQDTDALVDSALQAIPPRDLGSGNYRECMTVAMALVAHYGESEGERIIEQWSPSIKGSSWDVPRKARSFKRGGVGLGSLFHIAKQHGWKFPTTVNIYSGGSSEQTITEEEWQLSFGLRNLFTKLLARLPKSFKKPAKPPKPSKPLPQPLTLKYIPGQLPSLVEYKARGCPTIRFAAGKRLQVLTELTKRRHHDILDSSATGTGKSHDAGLAEPSKLGADRLWYFSEDHRNPTTATVEANYADMPVRNNGLVLDDSRTTALGNSHIRWAQLDEQPNLPGNCFRTPLFHSLAAKGFQEDVGAEAKINPICGTCHLAGACAGQGDQALLPGAGYRTQRRDAFLHDRIKASLNSAPAAHDLRAERKEPQGGEAQAETPLENRNGAFIDEAMRQLKPVDEVTAFVPDFDQTFAELEQRLPEVHAALLPFRVAIRPILAGEVSPTKETYHGWNDAAIRSVLAPFVDGLPKGDDKSSALTIPAIIEQLESIKPKFEEIFREPDSFNKNGASAKDRSGISNQTSAFIRAKVRQDDYRDMAKQLNAVVTNWLIPSLEVLNGSRRGALRINNRMLTVTTLNTRHAEVCKAMEFVVYKDATATREYLALYLDIDPTDIIQIEEEPATVENLTITQVTGLGLAGHDRSDSLQKRLEALKPALKDRHPDIPFLDHKKYASGCDGDGHWFNHNRGSNEYKTRSAIAGFGTPYQNIGALQDLWLTLTGDRNLDKDGSEFSDFVAWQAKSEVVQAVGRLRANLRPEEPLNYYHCGDFDLSFLQHFYPGATIKQEEAVMITPEAGKPDQCHRYSFLQGAKQALEAGVKLTLTGLAEAAGISKGRVSQIAAEWGGWKAFRKCLDLLLEAPYRKPKHFSPLTEEQQYIVSGYLPLVADETSEDISQALAAIAKGHGWEALRAILAASSSRVRGKLFGGLISSLPSSGYEEIWKNIKSPPDLEVSFGCV